MDNNPFRPFDVASTDELHRAHDLLHAIIAGEVQLTMQPENMRLLHATHDVLCWVLGHHAGATFVKILNTALECAQREGVHGWRNLPPV